jgi:hypothetical protein
LVRAHKVAATARRVSQHAPSRENSVIVPRDDVRAIDAAAHAYARAHRTFEDVRRARTP